MRTASSSTKPAASTPWPTGLAATRPARWPAPRAPRRSWALGVAAKVDFDTSRIDLKAGDRLLICSDGLTNMLSDDTIAATLRRHPDPQQAADTLVDMANQAGGDDNITVVILDALADGSGGAAAAMPVAAASVGAEDAEPALDPPGAEPPAALRIEPAGRRRREGVVLGQPIRFA